MIDDSDRPSVRIIRNRQTNFRRLHLIKYNILQVLPHLTFESIKMAPLKFRRATHNRRRAALPSLLPHQRFPKAVRNELRMTAVLRCLSTLREGQKKTQTQQQQLLHDYYHGKGDKYPSQIQMLTEGTSYYKDLYDVKTKRIVVTQKNAKKSSKTKQIGKKSLVLKTLLSREDFMTFTAGDEIDLADLKRKHRITSTEALSGRNLLDMARRGMRDFRKAMAFAKDKWDIKNNQPLESGMTVDDCIEYVRRRMYLHSHIKIDDDDDDENVDDNDNTTNNENRQAKKDKAIDITVDVASSKRSKQNNNEDNTDNNEDEKNDDDINDQSTEIEMDSFIDDDRKPSSKRKGDDDDDSYKNQSEVDDDEDNDDDENDEIIIDDDDEENDDEVPYNYVFNSYMAFVMWGPFAKKEKKLSLFLLGKYKRLFWVCL